MTISDAEKNWRDLPQIVQKGVETLPQLLIHQAQRYGEKVLHRKKNFGIWECFTWKDVLQEVKLVAMGLAAIGINRGETIAIVGENEPELFWSEYAAQSIGAKVICLYPDLTFDQIEYMINHSEAVAIICEDQEQVDKVLEIESRIPEVKHIVYWDDRGMWQYDHPKLQTFKKVQSIGKEHLEKNPGAFKEAVAAGQGSDIAVLSYTSGTTGLPKACIMTHNNLFDTAFRVAGASYIKPFTQYLSYISPAWGTEQMFGLTIGLLIPCVVNFPEEPETVQDNIREIGTEALVLSPRQWESLASLVEAKMMNAGKIRQTVYKMGIYIGHKVNLPVLEGRQSSLKWRLIYPLIDKLVLYPLRDNLGLQDAFLAFSGGSGMAPDVFRFFHAMGVNLRNVFGTTEMGLLTQHQGETFDLETVGQFFPVYKKFGQSLQYRLTKQGELLVKGGSGFSGYYKDSAATAEKITSGWFRTEDALHITEKNELVYLERVKDMRELSNGHRYPPQFIENRLRFSPFIKEVMTLGDQTKPFVSAFINIDESTLGPWAEQNKLSYTTYTDLSQNGNIIDLIRSEIKQVNNLLPENSRIMRFITLPKELDPDEDELTRTRKLRRKFLENKYASFITAVYDEKDHFEARIPVKYQDGRTGELTATIKVNNL